ncbi:peptidase S8/S53 domain-containing protein [Paraphysoderma sedebokerense]|nr:peptidase S8/S53 domain-containing protein [Paraphysoderma sedebokerense]
MDCKKNGHGTHVAGIAGGFDANFRGVAPSVTFGAYRVFGCEGSTSDALQIMAMEQAMKDGMDIVNLSIGGGSNWASDPPAVAATNLVKAGVIVVCSAGNRGSTHGLYQISSPGIGKNVISVASVDNAFVNRTVMLAKEREIGYMSDTKIESFVQRGIANATVLLTSQDADGCKAFPENTFKGNVALIRRGTCSFTDKVINAQNAGALGVILYNSEAGLMEGFAFEAAKVKVPVAGISGEDGKVLLESAENGHIDVSFPTLEKSFPVPTAGQPSSFSSWGLGNDLEVKPDVSGIGGQVFSSWPRSTGKSYHTMSGTSMASPYVAGIIALYLEAFPGSSAQTILETIQNTARPSLAPSNNRFANSVAKQGAGLVDALAFISVKTRVSPSRLKLLDTTGSQMIKRKRITIKNNGNRDMKYFVEHLPAQTIVGKIPTSPTPLETAARVTMSPSSLTLGPGKTGAVDITIIGDTAWPDSDRIIYSGYIKVIAEATTNGYSPIHVPYAGFKGNYDQLEAMSNEEIVLNGTAIPSPSLVKLKVENDKPVVTPYDKSPFNLTNERELAAVVFRVNHPIRDLTLSWVDTKTNQVIGAAAALPIAQPIGLGDALPYNLLIHGKGNSTFCSPGSGMYKFNLTYESGFDDKKPVIRSLVSDIFEVTTSAQGNCTATVYG